MVKAYPEGLANKKDYIKIGDDQGLNDYLLYPLFNLLLPGRSPQNNITTNEKGEIAFSSKEIEGFKTIDQLKKENIKPQLHDIEKVIAASLILGNSDMLNTGNIGDGINGATIIDFGLAGGRLTQDLELDGIINPKDLEGVIVNANSFFVRHGIDKSCSWPKITEHVMAMQKTLESYDIKDVLAQRLQTYHDYLQRNSKEHDIDKDAVCDTIASNIRANLESLLQDLSKILPSNPDFIKVKPILEKSNIDSTNLSPAELRGARRLYDICAEVGIKFDTLPPFMSNLSFLDAAIHSSESNWLRDILDVAKLHGMNSFSDFPKDVWESKVDPKNLSSLLTLTNEYKFNISQISIDLLKQLDQGSITLSKLSSQLATAQESGVDVSKISSDELLDGKLVRSKMAEAITAKYPQDIAQDLIRTLNEVGAERYNQIFKVTDADIGNIPTDILRSWDDKMSSHFPNIREATTQLGVGFNAVSRSIWDMDYDQKEGVETYCNKIKNYNSLIASFPESQDIHSTLQLSLLPLNPKELEICIQHMQTPLSHKQIDEDSLTNKQARDIIQNICKNALTEAYKGQKYADLVVKLTKNHKPTIAAVRENIQNIMQVNTGNSIVSEEAQRRSTQIINNIITACKNIDANLLEKLHIPQAALVAYDTGKALRSIETVSSRSNTPPNTPGVSSHNYRESYRN